VIVHDHHNDPNDLINRSKRKTSLMHYPANDPAAVVRDKSMGAWLIGLLALIIVGGLIFTVFDRMTDPAAIAIDSGSSGSRTTTGSVN
jgi:hypothetical protein